MRFAQFFKQYFSRFLVSLSVFLSSCPPVFAGDGGSLRTFWDHVCGLALIGAVIVTTLFYLAEYKFLDTFFPTRYKITATVEVNSQVYQGSAVQQYYCYKTAKWIQMLDHGQCLVTKGAAIVVDLKEKGYLFVLMRGRNFNDNSAMVMDILMERQKNLGEKPLNHDSKKWLLTASSIPSMVAFSDTQNPETILEVDPSNLAGVFGPNVKLKSVEVEETKNTVDFNEIHRVLPWLKTRAAPKSTLKTFFSDRLAKINFIFGEGE